MFSEKGATGDFTQAMNSLDSIRRMPLGAHSASMLDDHAENENDSKAEKGFSMPEVLIVSVLLLMLAGAGFTGLMGMNRASKGVAEDAAGLELVEGKIEELRGTLYNPPYAPFASNTYRTTNTVTVCLNASGSNALLTGRLLTTTQPLSGMGHLVTVSLSITSYPSARAIQLQTVINKMSMPSL